jgi:hypothetical protein
MNCSENFTPRLRLWSTVRRDVLNIEFSNREPVYSYKHSIPMRTWGPPNAADLAREVHMARSLNRLLAQGETVMWVGGMAHWTRIVARIDSHEAGSAKADVTRRRLFKRMRLSPTALYWMTGRLPWLIARYAQDPSAFEEHTAMHLLCLEARKGSARQSVPFQIGLRDGLDVRATLRNWTSGKIYVREEQRCHLNFRNGAIDWVNSSEHSDLLSGKVPDGGWIDPDLRRMGSCSRETVREVLQKDPWIQRDRRLFTYPNFVDRRSIVFHRDIIWKANLSWADGLIHNVTSKTLYL